jgi:hypothetical protein
MGEIERELRRDRGGQEAYLGASAAVSGPDGVRNRPVEVELGRWRLSSSDPVLLEKNNAG